MLGLSVFKGSKQWGDGVSLLFQTCLSGCKAERRDEQGSRQGEQLDGFSTRLGES